MSYDLVDSCALSLLGLVGPLTLRYRGWWRLLSRRAVVRPMSSTASVAKRVCAAMTSAGALDTANSAVSCTAAVIRRETNRIDSMKSVGQVSGRSWAHFVPWPCDRRRLFAARPAPPALAPPSNLRLCEGLAPKLLLRPRPPCRSESQLLLGRLPEGHLNGLIKLLLQASRAPLCHLADPMLNSLRARRRTFPGRCGARAPAHAASSAERPHPRRAPDLPGSKAPCCRS